MTFHDRDRLAVLNVFLITLFVLVSTCIGELPFTVQPAEMATVAGKVFSYKLPAEMIIHSGYTFKFHTPDSENLPSWLKFDESSNVFLGVPSYHDKGSHTIQLDVIIAKTNKTADTINLLTIEVVEYEEDLNHFKMVRTNTLTQTNNHNKSQSSLDCPNHAPVIVATLVFDLNSRKLNGRDRVELLKSVSGWVGIDIDHLRWMPGKGEKTAFNLKDAVVLTAGPGWVKDPQERGVSVSWKIGCGDSATESEKSYVSVGQLKSASQTGAFKSELISPVVAWHVIYGRVKRRQVVRVRRQAVAQTPVPTSSFVTPTSVIATQIISTPRVTRSPSAFTVTPTGTRITPSPTQTAISKTTSALPLNTPPYLNNPINILTAVMNEPFLFFIPPNTFHDNEDGETPNLSLDMYDKDGNVLPSNIWINLDRKPQRLYGTPDAVGNTTICLIVTDSECAKSTLHRVIISVVWGNDPPYLYNHIDFIPLYIGQPLAYKVPYDTFYDKEDGPTRNLTLLMRTVSDTDISSKPWVTFDAKDQTIYALPYGEIIGEHEFLMIAYDSNRKKAVDAFEFHIYPITVKPNHKFGLELEADYNKFERSVTTRVKLCVTIGNYFRRYFNTSYEDIRVEKYWKGSVILEWNFANIATNKTGVYDYKSKYVVADTDKQPVSKFKKDIDEFCPIKPDCSATKAWVNIIEAPSTTPDPDVIARVDDDDDDGDWWEYTIIPAFVIAALIFIIGLIIIICIRCRRKNKLDKNERIVFVKRKKPAVFREEYPMRETYGNQPLLTPNEKAPLPPPAYPRSSTPTEDPSERLSDSSPSYQPPFDSGHETAGNSRPPAASYRLPPPYVAP